MAKKHDRKARRDVTTKIVANDPLPRLLEPVRPQPRIRVTPSSVDLRAIEDRRLFHPDSVRPALNLDNQVHRLVAPKPKRDRFMVVQGVRKRLDHHEFRLARELGTKVVSNPALGSYNRRPVAFSDFKRVLVCVRRAMRTQVLHALKKTGKGGSRKKQRPRYNEWSNVRCR